MDFELEHFLNRFAGTSRLLDALMRASAQFGEWVFFIAVASWFIYGWWRSSSRDREGALVGLFAALAALLVNQLLCHLWVRPRPYLAHPGLVRLLVRPSADPSFPSDHAAASFAIALVACLRRPRLGAALSLVAVVMCVARVFVGLHYPGDVLGGAAIGSAVAMFLCWRKSLGRRLLSLTDTVLDRLKIGSGFGG